MLLLKKLLAGIITVTAVATGVFLSDPKESLPETLYQPLIQTQAPADVDYGPNGIYDVLVVGDSIACGATPEASCTEGYRRRLGQLFGNAGVPYAFHMAALGETDCGYWAQRIQGIAASVQPDLIIFTCGTNESPSTIDSNYYWLMVNALYGAPAAKLLPTWISYSDGRLRGWLPPVEAAVNDGIYRQVIPNYHGLRQLRIADMQGIPLGYIDQQGVHPTTAGYDVMAELLYDSVAERYGLPRRPPPCGLTAHRPGGFPPAYRPCSVPAE